MRSLFGVLVMVSGLLAAVIHVPAEQPTIQAGLNTAQSGDTVLVASGTYPERVTWPGRDGIKLYSDSGPAATIIDAESLGRVVYFNSSAITRATEVRGFTITRGINDGAGIKCQGCSPSIIGNIITGNCPSTGERNYGAGIHCYGWYETTAPLIKGNSIIRNTSTGPEHRNYGGGIHSAGPFANPEICENLIADNRCIDGWYDYGAGIYLEGQARIYQNVFLDNFDSGPTFVEGGAISAWTPVNALVFNNLFIGNRTMSGWLSYGGAIHVNAGSMLIINNTFARNACLPLGSTSGGGAVYLSGGDSAVVKNNIFANDTASNGSGVFSAGTPAPLLSYNNYFADALYGCSPGIGDTFADPVFVSGWAGDYFLSQVAAGQPVNSPCLDRGDTLTMTSPLNLDSLLRIWTTRTDSIADMGVIDIGNHYGFSAFPTAVAERFTHNASRLTLGVSPNPARGSARITYSLPRPGRVSLRLYDSSGRLVRVLHAGHVGSGVSSFELRISDFPRGFYLCRLELNGNLSATQKLVVD